MERDHLGADPQSGSGRRTHVRAQVRPSAEPLQRAIGNRAFTAVLQRLTPPANTTRAAKAHTKALEEQRANREYLHNALFLGRYNTGDRRLANACEWVLTGRAKVYAVTQTGDSAERVAHEEGQPDRSKGAWFPEATGTSNVGALDQPISDYAWQDLDDNTNVEFDDFDTMGWNLPGHIAIVNPRKLGKKAIWETVKHEVVHASDGSAEKKADAKQQAMNGGLSPAQATESPQYKLERYKTEYRAYSYEGAKSTSAKSDTKQVTALGYTWTERQLHIFQQIYSGYPHTETGWDDNPDVGGGVTFREAVVAYVNPDAEGFNKYDSVRVDELYKQLSLVPDGTRDYMDEQFLVHTMGAARKLKAEDAAYILGDAPDWTRLINRKLGDMAYSMLMDLLRRKAKG